MSDRLQELLRQRSVIQAHLEWLDRQIASESPSPSGSPPPAPPPPKLAANEKPSPSAALTLADLEAEAILSSYRQDQTSLRSDVRKGCLLYFFGAFAVLGIALTVFYFIYSRTAALPP